MKTKHLVLTAATILWGTTMLSQTGIVNAGGTPITYPVTYPTPTPRPTPTAVPSSTPRPTPTSYPITYPKPTPTPAPVSKISGKIYLFRFPFSRSKVDYSKIKVVISSTKSNFTINMPVDKNGNYSTTLVAGTYKVMPVANGITFYPQSRVVSNTNWSSMYVDFFGLIF